MSTKSEALKKREAELGAAKKKKKIKIIIIIAACVLLAALIAGGIYYFLQMKVDPDLAAGIDGAEIYFGETECRALRDLGEPDRTEITAEDIREINYYYDNVKLFGSDAVMILTFVKNELRSVKSTIVTHEGLYNEIIEHMREHYKDKDGYSTTDDDIVKQYQTCRIESLNDERDLICDVNDENISITFTEYVGFFKQTED